MHRPDGRGYNLWPPAWLRPTVPTASAALLGDLYHGDGIEDKIWEPRLHPIQGSVDGLARAFARQEHRYRDGPGTARGRDEGSCRTSEIDLFKPTRRPTAEHLVRPMTARAPMESGSGGSRTTPALDLHDRQNVKPSKRRRATRSPAAPAGRPQRLPRWAVATVPLLGTRADSGRGHGQALSRATDSVPRIETVIKEERSSSSRNVENGLEAPQQCLPQDGRSARSLRHLDKEAFDLHRDRTVIRSRSRESRRSNEELSTDRRASRPPEEGASDDLPRLDEAAAVSSTGPARRRQEVVSTTATSCAGDSTISTRRQGHRNRSSSGTAWPSPQREPGKVHAGSSWCAPTGTRSMARAAARSGGYARYPERPGFVFQVTDTKKENDFTLHVGKAVEGRDVDTGLVAEAEGRPRTSARRSASAHSATHVLHHAPLHIPSRQARPAGGEQGRARPALRLDFATRGRRSRWAPADRGEASTAWSQRASPSPGSRCRLPRPEPGAMALFGEEVPRGGPGARWATFRELCGGTHSDNVGQVSPSRWSVRSRSRPEPARITALTGKAAP